MGIAVVGLGSIAAAAYALTHSPAPRSASHLDPYTVWMVRNLPSPRAWHR